MKQNASSLTEFNKFLSQFIAEPFKTKGGLWQLTPEMVLRLHKSLSSGETPVPEAKKQSHDSKVSGCSYGSGGPTEMSINLAVGDKNYTVGHYSHNQVTTTLKKRARKQDSYYKKLLENLIKSVDQETMQITTDFDVVNNAPGAHCDVRLNFHPIEDTAAEEDAWVNYQDAFLQSTTSFLQNLRNRNVNTCRLCAEYGKVLTIMFNKFKEVRRIGGFSETWVDFYKTFTARHNISQSSRQERRYRLFYSLARQYPKIVASGKSFNYLQQKTVHIKRALREFPETAKFLK